MSATEQPQPEGLPWGIIDPDYARIFTRARIVAWQYGFALLMHGSFTRDLDLLLVPWEDRASDKMAELVVKRIANECKLKLRDTPDEAAARLKPHGRKAYTLFLPDDNVRWVDLSVMPCGPAPEVAA